MWIPDPHRLIPGKNNKAAGFKTSLSRSLGLNQNCIIKVGTRRPLGSKQQASRCSSDAHMHELGLMLFSMYILVHTWYVETVCAQTSKMGSSATAALHAYRA